MIVLPIIFFTLIGIGIGMVLKAVLDARAEANRKKRKEEYDLCVKLNGVRNTVFGTDEDAMFGIEATPGLVDRVRALEIELFKEKD